MPGTVRDSTRDSLERKVRKRSVMVAALQAPPRVRTDGKRAPARVVPLRLVPDHFEPDRFEPDGFESDRFVETDLRPERVVVVHRQPRPRVTRSKRAMYLRRRVIAAALGLGIVLTAAHAGLALG